MTTSFRVRFESEDSQKCFFLQNVFNLFSSGLFKVDVLILGHHVYYMEKSIHMIDMIHVFADSVIYFTNKIEFEYLIIYLSAAVTCLVSPPPRTLREGSIQFNIVS